MKKRHTVKWGKKREGLDRRIICCPKDLLIGIMCRPCVILLHTHTHILNRALVYAKGGIYKVYSSAAKELDF